MNGLFVKTGRAILPIFMSILLISHPARPQSRFIPLGIPDGKVRSFVAAVSPDGLTVVGSLAGSVSEPFDLQGFIWTEKKESNRSGSLHQVQVPIVRRSTFPEMALWLLA